VLDPTADAPGNAEPTQAQSNRDANREIALRNGLMAWIDPTLRLSNVKRVDRPTRSNGRNARRS